MGVHQATSAAGHAGSLFLPGSTGKSLAAQQSPADDCLLNTRKRGRMMAAGCPASEYLRLNDCHPHEDDLLNRFKGGKLLGDFSEEFGGQAELEGEGLRVRVQRGPGEAAAECGCRRGSGQAGCREG